MSITLNEYVYTGTFSIKSTYVFQTQRYVYEYLAGWRTKDHRISVALLQLKHLAHLQRMVDLMQLVNSRDKIKQTRKETCSAQKQKVSWPGASEVMEWSWIINDFKRIMEGLKGTAKSKCNRMGEVIYNDGLERYGVCQKARRKSKIKPRQDRLKGRLIWESRQLKKEWKQVHGEQRVGIRVLQAEVKSRMATLRRAELLWTRRRKKKEQGPITWSLYSLKKKMRSLRVKSKDLEEYLQQVHTDIQRQVELELPDRHSSSWRDSPMDDGLPRWKGARGCALCKGWVGSWP